MEDNKKDWPSEGSPCYDCGSSIPGHHTKLCAFSDPDDTLDLEAAPGTQWWVGRSLKKKENK